MSRVTHDVSYVWGFCCALILVYGPGGRWPLGALAIIVLALLLEAMYELGKRKATL